jgi:hypothetical protein
MTCASALRAGLVAMWLALGAGAWAQDTEVPASPPAAEDVAVMTEQAAAEAVAMGMGAAAALGGMLMTILLINAVVSILVIASLWVIFTKAGLPGWGSIIPIYNIILLLKAAGKPAWWVAVILLVPVVNLVFAFLALVGLANNFGKGGGYAAGLFFLPVIFFPMLAFGKAQHVAGGAAAAPAGQDAAPAPGRRPGAIAAATPVVTVPAGNLTIFSILALVALLCVVALVALQYLEMTHLSAEPSVWPPGP